MSDVEGMTLDEAVVIVVEINRAVAGLGYSLVLGLQQLADGDGRTGIVEVVARLTRNIGGSARTFRAVETDVWLSLLSRETLVCVAFNAMQEANQRLLNSILDEI